MNIMPTNLSYSHFPHQRVIQPPGGQTADIFASRPMEPSGYSSASSQAGSDVASSRIHTETDQQSLGGHSVSSVQLMDGILPQQIIRQPGVGDGKPVSPASVADEFKPQASAASFDPVHQKLLQMQLQQQQKVNRSPKKTIPVIRRNPITGEIYDTPVGGQPAVVRVRQPPGGRSSGIF